MTDSELIQKLKISTNANQIFGPDWAAEYKKFALLIHPDKCNLDGAKDAFAKLSQFKDTMENGHQYQDEISIFRHRGNQVIFTGPMDKLKLSLENYNKIKGKSSILDKYLPLNMKIDDINLIVTLQYPSVLCENVTLEEKHAKWVLNRCLEFGSLLNDQGFTHVGLNPQSIMICPEIHGIQIISFYHTVGANTKLKSAIGSIPYKLWYPHDMWGHKTAKIDIDLHMSKRLAAYLLGDRSGSGTSLRGKVDGELLNYILQNDDSKSGYFKYQDLLNKNPRIFHELTISQIN